MRRRTLLAVLGTGTIGSLAGCLSASLFDDDEPPETRIESIGVGNWEPVDISINILITEAGTPVFYRRVDLEGWPPEDNWYPREMLDGYPTEPGDHTLHVWHEGDDPADGRTFDIRDHSQSCVELDIFVGDLHSYSPTGDITVGPLSCREPR